MGVTLNMAFDDGAVVALWRITEGDGKSLSEQRLAVNALIDKVFEGKYRMSHDDDGIPVIDPAPRSETARRNDGGYNPENGEPPFVSISHTRGWAAVMTNPTEHIGIDIELSDRDFSAVGKKALSGAELARLDIWAGALENSMRPDMDGSPSETASAPNPRNTVLGLLWCAKEAVYKKLTVPATDFANQIEIGNIVPVPTSAPKTNSEQSDGASAKGEIAAIFKGGGRTEIRLEYAVIFGLLMVYTI